MIRRSGNFGFVDDGAGLLYSFNLNAKQAGGWTPSSYMIRGGYAGTFGCKYMSVNGQYIIPYGPDNNMPGRVCQLLENFYAGEGIMGKKVGLQWGEGPRLYRDAVEEGTNRPYRDWLTDPAIMEQLQATDYLKQMHRCLIDLCHLEGFWVKFTRTRGSRLGEGRLAKIEHVPAGKVRFLWEGEGVEPSRVMVADFPAVQLGQSRIYPLFDPREPFRYPVSYAYYNVYSYNHDFYSVPRFIGAFGWLELVGSLAQLLITYNENASAISKHIESPKSYWDAQEQWIKEQCAAKGETYNPQMLENFKDMAMERFVSSMSGKENVGKFLHTSQFWNPEASHFEGWKITTIDNKLKEYIDAQIEICKKAEAAATSGFGLDPSLSNLILDSKLGSGSEKLYALKVYNATETAIADMILCKPFQQFIEINNPGTDIKIGLYRSVVDAEKNINPENRLKANA